MLSLLRPSLWEEQRWEPPLLRKRPQPSFSSPVHASNELSVSILRKACLCLSAGAFASHQRTPRHVYGIVISTVNRKCLAGSGRLCLVRSVCAECVRAHTHTHIANTAIPFHTCRCSHQRAADFPYATRLVRPARPLTVERQQLPSGFCVCCSVMKAFLISGLGCSLPGTQLETAEINTCSPAPRSQMMTKPHIQDPLRVSAGSCWHREVFIPASGTLSGH